jgi:hypothetical protein
MPYKLQQLQCNEQGKEEDQAKDEDRRFKGLSIIGIQNREAMTSDSKTVLEAKTRNGLKGLRKK